MGDKITNGIEQWLSIGSKTVTVLFLPSLWVFHLYLDSHLDKRFEELTKDFKDEFVQQDDSHVFAKNDALTTFKTKTNSELQNLHGKVDINDAKVDAFQANTDLRLETIKEDISEIKDILIRVYPQ